MDPGKNLVRKKIKTSRRSKIVELFLLLAYIVYSYVHLLYRYIFPKRLKTLDGEVFLVTGCASGIGREVTYFLARNHPKTTLVLWDSNESENQRILEAVKIVGVEAFAYTVDVSNREQVERCAKRVFEEVGYVTILFNNAGVVGVGDILSQSPEKIQKTMEVNLLSHFWILRAFLPEMLDQNYGHIVTTCSAAGFIGVPYDVPYAASKWGVRGYLESLKAELRVHHQYPRIRFTTVHPSFVNTPLISKIRYKMKMQWFFEKLEPRHVAARIIEGIRRNEENVFIPRGVELVLFLKSIVPHRAYQKMQEYILESVHFEDGNNGVKQ